jgi:hypothetical protein
LVSLTVSTDGFVLSPAHQGPRVSMHMGRSVFMVSERGGYKHRGLAVHGDLQSLARLEDLALNEAVGNASPSESFVEVRLRVSPRGLQ